MCRRQTMRFGDVLGAAPALLEADGGLGNDYSFVIDHSPLVPLQRIEHRSNGTLAQFPDFGFCEKNGKRMPECQGEYVAKS